MIRPANAVDVLISGFTGEPAKDQLVGTILRHTKIGPERAAEIASKVLARRKVMFQMESQASADSMAGELRASCFVVSVTK
jgi:hypothetical protein